MDMTAWGEFSPMLFVAWSAGRCGSSVLLFPGRDACWAWRAFSSTSSHWALAVSTFSPITPGPHIWVRGNGAVVVCAVAVSSSASSLSNSGSGVKPQGLDVSSHDFSSPSGASSTLFSGSWSSDCWEWSAGPAPLSSAGPQAPLCSDPQSLLQGPGRPQFLILIGADAFWSHAASPLKPLLPSWQGPLRAQG